MCNADEQTHLKNQRCSVSFTNISCYAFRHCLLSHHTLNSNPYSISSLPSFAVHYLTPFMALVPQMLVHCWLGCLGASNTWRGCSCRLRVVSITGLGSSTLIQPSSNFPLVSKVPCNIQVLSSAPLGPSSSNSPQ